MARSGPTDPSRTQRGEYRTRRVDLRLFIMAERIVLSLVGAMFFVAAFALALRATSDLWAVVAGSRASAIVAATTFLDLMLLVLMLVELAYTVVTSFRGSELSAEPFLIVGLIAVIRRILVITIGSVSLPGSSSAALTNTGVSGTGLPIELGVLTLVVLVFVGSIAILRTRAHNREEFEPVDGSANERWD